MSQIEIRFKGPLFDGRPEFLVREWLDETREVIAARGVNYVSQYLDASIRNPTPYYETQITVQTLGGGVTTIHDRGIVYGPWLEGISRRNASTRFKGYRSFRRATAALERDVPQLLRTRVNVLVRRLNGR